jgi:hypothetical protein
MIADPSTYSDADLNLEKKHLLSFPDATWQEFFALAGRYTARGSFGNASGCMFHARLRGMPAVVVQPIPEPESAPDDWTDV